MNLPKISADIANSTSEYVALTSKFLTEFKYIVAFAVLIITVLASEYVANLAVNRVKSQDTNNPFKARMHVFTSLFVSLVRAFLILAVATWLLYKLGFSTSTIVGTLGIVIAGMTLALQDAARNVIAGISMVIYDYYNLGDL